MGVLKTTEEFISEAREVWGDLYDYSRSIYTGANNKTEILCKEHGSFLQAPSNHLRGFKCKKCSLIVAAQKCTKQTSDFVAKSRKLHGDAYDYSKVEYVEIFTPVIIGCQLHGDFEQVPNNHLQGNICPACAKERSRRKAALNFLSKSSEVHGEKYDYSLAVYEDNRNKVRILCSQHGEFHQAPAKHMLGHGCPRCMKSGYQINRAGSLYILSHENITKVGITNRDVNVRLRDITRDSEKDFKLDFFIKFSDGTIPQRIEKAVLQELREEYETPKETHDGYTECFVGVDKEALLYRVTKLCGEAFSARQTN